MPQKADNVESLCTAQRVRIASRLEGTQITVKNRLSGSKRKSNLAGGGGRTLKPEILLQNRPDRSVRYSASPWDLLADRENLQEIDLWVYCVLASRAFSSDTFQMGVRWVADCLKISPNRASLSIRRLVARGHVEVVAKGNGSRQSVYRLTARVFAKKQRVRFSNKQGAKDLTRDQVELLRQRLKTG